MATISRTRMAPKSIEDLMGQVARQKQPTNAVDQWIMMLLLATKDEKYMQPFRTEPPLREFLGLIREASSEGTLKDRAFSAILTARESMEAEASNNRPASVKLGLKLLDELDEGEQPYLIAMTHLRLGTVLASLSREDGDKSKLAQAISHMEKCLPTFTQQFPAPDLSCMAHYNLALAYDTIWRSGNEWEDADDKSSLVEKIVSHGETATKLMDQGISCGSRRALVQPVLQAALDIERRNPKDRKKITALIIYVIEGLLHSDEGKKLGPKEKEYRELLDSFRKQL